MERNILKRLLDELNHQLERQGLLVRNPMRLKRDAFPFQRHGTMAGRLWVVSEDAYNGAKGGLLLGRVQGRRPWLPLACALLEGSSQNVSIATGQRHFLPRLKSPLVGTSLGLHLLDKIFEDQRLVCQVSHGLSRLPHGIRHF